MSQVLGSQTPPDGICYLPYPGCIPGGDLRFGFIGMNAPGVVFLTAPFCDGGGAVGVKAAKLLA
jgi:hypothetical protein